jgi:glycerol-3-phosphate acyltransferase PlsX
MSHLADTMSLSAMPGPVRIAVDCMGGDHGPAITLPACRAFLDHNPEGHLVMVGFGVVI